MDVQPDALQAHHHYNSERFRAKIRPLVQSIQTEFVEWKIDEEKIGEFVRNLNILLEEVLGKEGSEKSFMKFPAKLFRDVLIDGSLHSILRIYRHYLTSQSFPELDFSSNQDRERSIAFIIHLKEALEKAQMLSQPVIHVDVSTGDRKQELEEIARSLGAKVSETADDEQLTHVVYSFGAGGDPDDGVQYLRSLESGLGEFFVHYWYYPDSYDNWMASDMAPENLEPDHRAIGPWKVYMRWLLDSKRFNEWMNPIDYETEEFQEEQETLRFQAEDQKMLDEDDEDVEDGEDLPQTMGYNSEDDLESMTTEEKAQLKRKREALSDFNFTETAKHLNDGMTPPGKKQVTEDHCEIDQSAAEKIAPNVIRHKMVDMSQVCFDGPVKRISDSLPEPKVDEQEQYKRQVYTIPLHASWFDWESVHEVEKDSIPFLIPAEGASIDLDEYKSMRNSIVNLFRATPSRHLKFVDVRREVAGEETQLKMVCEFLDQWGLINYFPSYDGSRKGPVDSSDWESSVLLPSSAPPLVAFSNMVSFSETEAAITGGSELSFGLLSKPNKYGRNVMESGNEKGRVRCNAMPWVDCTDLYYHCTTQPDIDLCPQAFTEGRFPTGTTTKDFVKITGSEVKPDGNGWTDQETLLLLEAIELYGEDWAEIAEHVATKSQFQCAMQWLTMPIEDDLINELLLENPAEDEEVLTSSVPFADAQNPIMAQVAFLAAMVSPEVAGAAAQEGLHILSQEDALSHLTEGSDSGNCLQNGLFGSSLHDQNHFLSISEEAIRKASIAALKSAAIKSKLLAEQQEREIKKLMMTILDSQMKKLEVKLSYCADQDQFLEEERINLCSSRHQVNAERMQLKSSVVSSETTTTTTILPPIGVPISSLTTNDRSEQMKSNGTTSEPTAQQNGH